MDFDNLKNVFDDDGIPPHDFLWGDKNCCKKVILSNAQAALSGLPDSDIEEDFDNEVGNMEDRNNEDEEDEEFEVQPGSDQDSEDEDYNIPLSIMKQRLMSKKGKHAKRKM
ncbi:unnamed protein product [Acanthoscelides obtectus]|uniref:Uncharacterized protein n=1 Tax=Acanthoscelides obtectus TaxID=200917 RepID=A0A9P0MG59_ACAOB|nr:unnamed protein product [Acanthoscelides obtectus]CAK1673547.1 hypothetical protein AOBTE_LOCUS29378 [Acanthoscelides obtectus]